jgi:hypothetical protein
MAKIDAGILRAVSGTLGNVVAVNRESGSYLRLKAVKTNNPQTEAQMAQRARFGLVMQFVRPLTQVAKIGLKNNPEGKAPYNYLFSTVIANAVKGVYPNLEVDYAAVTVSEGGLCQFQNLKVELVDGKMQFTWTHEGSERFGGWAENDQALLVVYNLTKKQVGYAIGESTRVTGHGEIALPGYFAGDTLIVYVAFVSADGNASSTSQYAGSFVMESGQ